MCASHRGAEHVLRFGLEGSELFGLQKCICHDRCQPHKGQAGCAWPQLHTSLAKVLHIHQQSDAAGSAVWEP
eukprot:scaffold452031_cov15-Prasinocladus_malaysianus.AAC.1